MKLLKNFLALLALVLVFLIVYGQTPDGVLRADEPEFSKIHIIENVSPGIDKEHSMAVDPYGNWHIAVESSTWLNENYYEVSIQYWNKDGAYKVDKRNVYYGDSEECWAGKEVLHPQIAVDATGGIQISYWLYEYGGTYPNCSRQRTLVLATSPKLLTLISGENSQGQELLGGSAALVRQDSDCQLAICQKHRGQSCDLEIADAVGQAQLLRQAVKDAAKKARDKGKDLIVSVDMDLENFKNKDFLKPPRANPWHPAVKWAAAVANTVSEAFKEDNPLGVRVLLAHSAGGDAAAKSIELKAAPPLPSRVYDRVFLLNARTSAKALSDVLGDLSKALGTSGYQNWQVKVFTSKGDRPNNPFWSLSDNKAARGYSGTAWTHIHAATFTGHDQLRDNVGTVQEGDFAVNLGADSWQENGRAVREMLMTELRLKPVGP